MQRKNKFEKIQKKISIESIELYFDSQKVENVALYNRYLEERRQHFDKIFKLQLIVYVDINPYNKGKVEALLQKDLIKDPGRRHDPEFIEKNRALLAQFYPIYEVQLQLQSVSFKLNSRNISSIGKLTELVRIHNQSYLEFR